VGVVGQAGATFSAVTLEPPPNLADTYLAISRQTDSTTSLYKLPYGSASPQLLYQNNQSPVYPGCSAYGSIAFSFVFGGLYTVRTDGTGLRQLSFTGASGPTCPQYSVDGTNRICFVANSGGLYVAPGTGGTPTLLQDSDTGYPGAWNPAGTLIAYSAVSGSAYQMMTTSTTSSGTTPNNITPTGFAGQFLETAWNADGQTIAVSLIPSGDSSSIK
jgi:hypothetical protein